MMMERFASVTDDILMSIAIERELLTLVAIAGDPKLGAPLTEAGILLPDTTVWFLASLQW